MRIKLKYVFLVVVFISIGYFFSDRFDENLYFKKNEASLNHLAHDFLSQNYLDSVAASTFFFTNEKDISLTHSYTDESLNDPQNDLHTKFPTNKCENYSAQIQSDPQIRRFSEHFNIPISEIDFWVKQIQRNDLYGIWKPKGQTGIVVITVRDNSHRFIYSKNPNVEMGTEPIRINQNWWYCSRYCL